MRQAYNYWQDQPGRSREGGFTATPLRHRAPLSKYLVTKGVPGPWEGATSWARPGAIRRLRVSSQHRTPPTLTLQSSSPCLWAVEGTASGAGCPAVGPGVAPFISGRPVFVHGRGRLAGFGPWGPPSLASRLPRPCSYVPLNCRRVQCLHRVTRNVVPVGGPQEWVRNTHRGGRECQFNSPVTWSVCITLYIQ